MADSLLLETGDHLLLETGDRLLLAQSVAFLAAWARGTNQLLRGGAMKKNVASQVVGVQMVSATDGSAFTGAVTVSVTGDGGAQATGSVGSGACTHEGNGYHTYAPAQAETNYDQVAFTFTGTGAVPVTITVYTTFPQTGDGFARLGAPVGASISADIQVVDDFLDTEVAAIKAKTDNLPSDPADASVVAGLIAAVETKVDAVDTVVDAIKVKTDALPTDPADQSLVIAATDAILTAVGTVDTVADAIKVKTDQLTFTQANHVDATARKIVATTLQGTGIEGDSFRPA